MLLFSSFALALSLAVSVAHETLGDALVRGGDALFGGSALYAPRAADMLYVAAYLLDAEDPRPLHQRARLAFLKGDFDDALRLINAQIGEHGDTFMASYYIRGLIRGYQKEFGAAEEDFKTFLSWDPENWAALNDLAWVYFAQGEFGEAKQTAERGLRVAPENPWLLTMHAMSRYNLGGTGVAEELERALKAAGALTEEAWVRAYPGNDPKIASPGLASLKRVISENTARVNREVAQPENALY